MDDLEEHVTFSANLGYIRICGPTSTRMGIGTELLALKVAQNKRKESQLKNETFFLLMLDHPNIRRGHGIYKFYQNEQHALGLLLDFKAGGALSNWIPAGGFPEWIVRGIAAQLRDVLLYLYRLRIVHRDIKPDNVLCEKAEDGSIKMCLADFGLASFAEEERKCCGTRGYIAPEMFAHSNTSFEESDYNLIAEDLLKGDIFSFGMLICTAAIGRNPLLNGNSKINDDTTNDGTDLIPRGITEIDAVKRRSIHIQELLKWCTARSPSDRCSIMEAADLAWFHTDIRTVGLGDVDDDLRGDSVSWVAFEQASVRAT
jgi:serine/threonine protein kinase